MGKSGEQLLMFFIYTYFAGLSNDDMALFQDGTALFICSLDIGFLMVRGWKMEKNFP